MSQKFDSARNVYLDLDQQGIVRDLIHTNAPVTIQAATPQLAAAGYLHQFAELFGVTHAQLANLSLSPSASIENAPVQYRFSEQKNQFDTTTVAFYQTDLGLPVWQAGISVQMKVNPFRVLSSQSTLHPDLSVETPTEDQVKRAQSIEEQELARLLGLESQPVGIFVPDPQALRIEKKNLVIYRYQSAQRVVANAPPRDANKPEGGQGAFQANLPTLPLPEVPDGIEEGKHYVCVAIDFRLPCSPIGMLHWVAIVEVQSLCVLYLRAFVDCINGLVFEIEPMTTNGGPLPNATSAALNPVRVSDTLPGLVAPSGGTQALTGNNVAVEDVEPPTVAPPTEPAGSDFNFDARTDNFAAVNCYYHCDKFFRLADGMGFSQSGYFGQTTFPVPVDHRGSMNTTNGIEINAHCVGNSSGAGILRTTFALADLTDTTNPIGIANDYRVVLHELAGHGTLWNHVNSPNFGFSHSAGDSVAAILNDPGTQAPDRFATFPWITAVNRRHDRTPAAGWGWEGTIALNPFSATYDGGGYNNEQILSTTHFRIYRSIGGDATDLPTQQFSARMVSYLILRAIATLTPATNAANAAAWATALTTADQGDWVSENITGGAYSKVIRWAFEKQGLYQPAGTATPNNNVGAPPAVDVYIDDGRGGEYTYQPNFWSNVSIWNRLNPDGGTTHQTPVTNQTNYAYVILKNRGNQNATNVVVNAYHANPAAGLSYPDDWIPMTTAQLPAADVPANNAAEITVGPFDWTPTDVGHECLFMVVSAAGDASNVNNIAAGDSIPEWRLVPNDNNIGQRNVFPIAGSGTSGLTEQFNNLSFTMKNPMLVTAGVEVRPVLPPFLQERGWKVSFLNAGGASFRLPPGDSRNMIIRLVPGADFTPADVNAANDTTIHLYGYAGGILVGGMSYVVDPNLKPGPTGSGHAGKCESIGTEILKCVEISKEKISKVRVRKITVDLEFADDDCECSE